MRRLRPCKRRGVSIAQTALVLVVIAIATIATLQRMSTATNTQLDVTSEGLVDPAVLRRHFSSDSGSGEDAGQAGY